MKDLTKFGSLKKFFSRGFFLLVILGVAGCNTMTSQETVPQIPKESAEPFYTGSVEIVQMPTQKDMGQDLVLKLDIAYKKDSTGHWPETYYGNTPYPKVPINAVEVSWYPYGYYGDSLGTFQENTVRKVVETIDSVPQSLDWIRLPTDKDSVTQSYKVIYSADEYKDLSVESEVGNLHLLIKISFSGGEISENPNEEDLLYRFNHSSAELIWITPATGSVIHRSLGSKDDPALSIIE